MKKKRQKHVNINESLSLREQLMELYTKYKRSFFNVIHNEQLRYLKDYVIRQTTFLPPETKMIIRLHCVLQCISELPMCKTCGKPIEIRLNKYKRFNHYCSASCRQRDATVYEKQSEKKLKVYGSVNNIQQMLRTKKKKYGVHGYNNPNKANGTKLKLYGQAMYDHEKYRETSKKRYGFDNYMQSENGKSHYRSEIEKKYGPGVINVLQLPHIREKGNRTKKDKYGDKNYNNPEQAKITCLKRYGVDHPSKSAEIQHRMKRRYEYDGVNFDTKPEIAYYIWLKDHGVKFEYHGARFFEYEFGGKTHRYFPDFYLVDDGRCVEIKGDQFFTESGEMTCPFRDKDLTDSQHAEKCALYEAKRKCMVANGVRILRNAEYGEYVKYAEDKYGKDYFDRFRKNESEEDRK